MENVIVSVDSTVGEARETVRGLRRLEDAGDIHLEAFALIERTEDGRTVVHDQVEDVQIKATATGGVVGGTIGLLRPLGVVAGAATGAVVGSLFDIAEAEDSDDVLGSSTGAVPPGRAATIAVVEEPTHAAVDTMASDLGIAVLRRPRAEVDLKIAEAETAAIARRRDEESTGTTE